jgi:hypothetical protein
MNNSETRPKLTLLIGRNEDAPVKIPVSLRASPTLANLASIFHDLLIASMTAHHANDPAFAEPGFMYARRACWEAAIASYSRCFEEGQGVDRQTRTRLDDYVTNLPAELRQCHDVVRKHRGKRIGHHVARESGQEVTFSLNGSQVGPELNMDFCVNVVTELYDVELLAKLEELTLRLRGEVGKRIDELRNEVFQHVTADFDGVMEAWRNGNEWKPAT